MLTMPTAVADHQASSPSTTPASAMAAWIAGHRVRAPSAQKTAAPPRPTTPIAMYSGTGLRGSGGHTAAMRQKAPQQA
jgi:hypothetical protein